MLFHRQRQCHPADTGGRIQHEMEKFQLWGDEEDDDLDQGFMTWTDGVAHIFRRGGFLNRAIWRDKKDRPRRRKCRLT